MMLSAGKIGSQSVIQSLKRVPPEISPGPSYHLHMFSDASRQFEYKLANEPRFNLDQIISGHALRCFWDKNNELFKWKFISGVRDPDFSTFISALHDITREQYKEFRRVLR